MSNRKQDIAYFVSFCVEQYKSAKGLSGEEAMNVLNDTGLLKHFEGKRFGYLHTQIKKWLVKKNDMKKDRTINQSNLYLLLPSKICWMADMLTTEKGISIAEAIKEIYSSNVYKQLEIEETKLWHWGPVALMEAMEE